MLLRLVYVLAAANALLLLGVCLREGWRLFQRKRFQRQRRACREQLQQLESLDSDGLHGFAALLEASFPPAVIATCLEEMADEATSPMRPKLADLYDDLGILQQRLDALTESRSWQERLAAAEKLGRIGHYRTVLPLVAVLQDNSEDGQVKAAAGLALGSIRDPRAVRPLVEVMGRDDSALSQRIGDVLDAFGEEAVPILVDVLRNANVDGQRRWAARILAVSKDPQTAVSLVAALKDHSQKVRAEAARSLGKMGARHAVHSLTEVLLRDPAAPVREEAASSLGEIGDERALDALKQALAEQPHEVRFGALSAMEKMGDRAIPVFLSALDEDDARIRGQAAVALDRCGYITETIEALAGEAAETRGPAYKLLRKVALAGVVGSIIQSLSHPDFKVRARLCQLLAEARNSRALEPLSELAQKDPEWAVRARALEALIRLEDERSRPVWLPHLNEEEESVRECMVESLLQLPSEALEPLVSDLLPYLQDQNVRIRTLMVRVIGSVRSETVMHALIASLKDSSAAVRTEAACLLGRYRQPEVARALERGLEDADPGVRANAVRALGRIKDPESIAALAKAFETADETYRDDISLALGAMKQEDFFALTDVLMGLSSPAARAGVAHVLGNRKDQSAVGLLQAFLTDPEPLVRSRAASALGQFASPDIGALLVPYLEDPDAEVRAAAVESIGKSGDANLTRWLIPMFSDPDPGVCRRSVLAVGQLGNSAASDHIQRFQARVGDPLSQAAAMIALELLGHRTGLETILEGLQDPELAGPLRNLLRGCTEKTQQRFFTMLALEPRVFWQEDHDEFRRSVVEHYVALLRSSRQPAARIRAMQALSHFGESRCVPFLETSLTKDPNSAVRSQALASLSNFLDIPDLLERLRVTLSDPANAVRQQAAQVLGSLKPDDVAPHKERLLDFLDTDNAQLQRAVSELLAQCYQRDWRALADILMGAEKKQRILGLIQTLGLMRDPQVRVLLLPMLGHKDPEVRELAAEQLPQVAGHLWKENLLPHLGDPSEKVRAAIVRCLERHIDQGAVRDLMTLCEDPSPLVRQQVAAVFGKAVPGQDERPVEALRRMVQDSSVSVRAQALASLLRLGVTGHRDIYEQVCSDLDEAALAELRDWLDMDGTLFRMLEVLYGDRSAGKREDALHLLATVDLERYAPDIALALQDPDSSVRIAAISVLGQHQDPTIQEAIGTLGNDPVPEVRQAARRARLRVVSAVKGA